MSSFCICKSYSHFFSKNTCELDIVHVLTKTINILTTNELVRLTMLWTTGPRSLDCQGSRVDSEDRSDYTRKISLLGTCHEVHLYHLIIAFVVLIDSWPSIYKVIGATGQENLPSGMCAQKKFRSDCTFPLSYQNIHWAYLDSQGCKVSSSRHWMIRWCAVWFDSFVSIIKEMVFFRTPEDKQEQVNGNDQSKSRSPTPDSNKDNSA